MTNFLENIYTSLSDNENLETATLIWLDNHLDPSADEISTQKKFRSAINHIKLFDNIKECEKYIQHLFPDDRIVLITNGRLGQLFIPCIYHFRQIISIYIFCMDEKKHELWTKDFRKIKGVFTSLDELIKNLISDQQRQTHTKIDEPLSINIFTLRNKTDQSTTALNYKFVYHNLFLDSLLQMTPTPKDKDELLTRCKDLYKSNPSQLIVINEFEETYRSDQAIWWYTRETFLYRLLNKALRIQNMDLLFFFRFFIADIQKQLEEDQCKEFIQTYRAQLISNEELNELKNSIGEYISINSFFSTTQDRKYALFLFGDTTYIHDDLQRVLFEIDANPNHIGIKPFADISTKSYFSNECEVLIMLGAVFRLDSIISNEDQIWIIHLSLCSDQDYELKTRIDQITREYNSEDINLFSFGRILHHMNKYTDAEKYYRRLITEFKDNSQQMGLCYYHLGRVYSGKGKYEESMKWYEKSLKIMMDNRNLNISNIAECYNSIANIYRKKEDYSQALETYEKAFIIWKEELGEDHLKIAMCLINMGVVYDAQENYIDALNCLKKALTIKQKYHGINHTDVAVLYNNIGLVHECLNHFDLALENFQKACDIYQTSHYARNIEYGTTLENIAHLYENKEKWRQALVYLEEAATIYRYTLPSTHPKVIQIEQTIGHVSSSINN